MRKATGGSGCFLMESMRGAIEQGARQAGGWWRVWWAVAESGALPESLDAVLSHRLSLLEESAREALSAAAILGREFHFGVWRKLTGLREDPLLEIAERLLKGQLLEEAGNDALRFVHDLLRQKLLSDLSGLKMRRLHAKAVKVLAEEPKAEEKYGEAIMEHPVGPGPFMIKEWRLSSKIVLATTPRYRNVLDHA